MPRPTMPRTLRTLALLALLLAVPRHAGAQEMARLAEQADSAFAAMAAADRPVQARLRAIVAGRGWPDRRLVADDGAHAAWLLLQHADSAFQREMLPAVRRAAAAGNVRLADAAYLEDRVLMGQGRPQRFGTQLRFDEATGRPALYPVEDEARVDERRAAAGMGSLADYLATQGIEYRGPGRNP